MTRPQNTRLPAGEAASRRGRVSFGALLDLSIAMLVALAGCFLLARNTGQADTLIRVGDHQVGVLVDDLGNRDGELVMPGYRAVVPMLQEVHLLDRQPAELVMEGHESLGPWQVPRLLVRARDGSSYWFERVAVQVGLDESQAAEVLQRTGTGVGTRAQLVHVHSRALLRQALGALTATQVLEPALREQAIEGARSRLGEALAAHGLQLIDLSLSTPAFDPRWEQTIERRKVAEQQIASLEREAQLLLDGEEATRANLGRQLELQLEKDRLTWARALDDLEQEAAQRDAEREEALAVLRREQELQLEGQRATLQAELVVLDRSLEQREQSRVDRLAMLEAEHERELALRRSTWDSARQQQEAQLERLPEQREARLNAVREQVALDGARSLASARLELEQARSAAVERAAAASQEAADRISAAEVTRDTDLALASSQLERNAAELGAFRVELDGLAQGGESSVRAALIQALAGVTVDLQSPRTEVELGSAGRARPSSHVSQEL